MATSTPRQPETNTYLRSKKNNFQISKPSDYNGEKIALTEAQDFALQKAQIFALQLEKCIFFPACTKTECYHASLKKGVCRKCGDVYTDQEAFQGAKIALTLKTMDNKEIQAVAFRPNLDKKFQMPNQYDRNYKAKDFLLHSFKKISKTDLHKVKVVGKEKDVVVFQD
jgi:hypothetical protein